MRSLLILTVVLAMTIATIHTAKLLPESFESIEDDFELDVEVEEPNGILNKHNKFFKQLTEMEKDWIVRLSLKHEADNLLAAEAEGNSFLRGASTNPIDQVTVIPKSVYDKLLNGHVPQKFHKKFINWVKKDLGYTEEELKLFRIDQPRFCTPGATACFNITNIGGLCCPFG